jgi:methylated-DNA-[protein]-cysteine S-methyltransferase
MMTSATVRNPDSLATRTLASPLGELTLHAAASGLRAILFPETRHPPGLGSPAATPSAAAARVLEQAARELDDYFAGRRRTFTLPLAPDGTAFQQRVWAALAAIPFAATWSYGRLAAAIGQPTASRAVGAANGRNPLPIVVPCHRVIGADGSATGYGGGLPAKRWLLAHEAAAVSPRLPL